MARVLVVDRLAAARDAIAELLPEHEVAWATREAAAAQLRTALAAGAPFDVVLLEGEPAPNATLVRELGAGGARVVLVAGGADGIAAAGKCGAADVLVRPFAAAELVVRVGRASPTDTRIDKRRRR